MTLTSIGFGDYVPGLSDVNSLSGQFRVVFAAFYIIFGLAIIAMGGTAVLMGGGGNGVTGWG